MRVMAMLSEGARRRFSRPQDKGISLDVAFSVTALPLLDLPAKRSGRLVIPLFLIIDSDLGGARRRRFVIELNSR